MRWRRVATAFALGDSQLRTLAAMFALSGIDLAFGATFTLLLVVAAGFDIRFRRIPNAVMLATLVLGAAFATVSLGARSGVVRVVEGAGMGLVLWLPFWKLGMIGAGDVKFFAAASAWLGPRLALEAAVASAVLGGVLGIGWLMWHVTSRSSTAHERNETERRAVPDAVGGVERGVRKRAPTLPYGVAMAAGLAITVWFGHVNH